MKSLFIIILALLLFSPFTSAKDLQYPKPTLKLEGSKIILKQEKRVYTFNEFEGIQRVLQEDVDGDGKMEYIIGVQFRYTKVDVPYGSVLICKQKGRTLETQKQIIIGDYFKDVKLFDVTKDGIMDLVIEGQGGMHFFMLNIISWQNGKYLPLLETGSGSGVFFETDEKGNAQVKIGIPLFDKEDWSYADEPDWEIWTWDGNKFVYTQGKTKESRSDTTIQPISKNAN